MTLSHVLNNHVSACDSNSARNTNHRIKSLELEERLLLCIHQYEQHKLPIVTGATIQAKADKIRLELLISTPDESAKLDALVFSPRWLSELQSHHRLTYKRVQASMSRAAIEKGRVALGELKRGYERHNVYRMDETAFFFGAPTTKTISTQRMAGRKKQQKKLTVAVCCNEEESTKVPLLFVGALRKPLCFDSSPRSISGCTTS
uniref:DNA binding protein putative n=1 Tax=Albugo laibachii Nc14 TaxID=890382 RepID=F0W3T6_9STRA|nr:DNA binding protein putative [Albugo laibachii Nc14]|eukprot:CCA15756.1 DNA binding protein putative [Albugo laibachii Nc14]